MLITEFNEEGGKLLLLNADSKFIDLFNCIEHINLPLNYSYCSRHEIDLAICKLLVFNYLY